MQPLFDRKGVTIGWLAESVVYDRLDLPKAFFTDELAVFTYEGKYLGQFRQGYFYERNGTAVAFMAGATGGPACPAPETAPHPPYSAMEPPRPKTIGSGDNTKFQVSWSALPWSAYLRGSGGE